MSRTPKVHGNGFIQLELNKGARLHVWPDGPIRRQKVDTGFHSHRFGFISKILCGELTQSLYEFSPREDGNYVLWYATTDGFLENTNVKGQLSCTKRTVLTKGDTYAMNPGEIHYVEPKGLTATLVQKTVETDILVSVFCLADYQPDLEFNGTEDNDEELLWYYIMKGLRKTP